MPPKKASSSSKDKNEENQDNKGIYLLTYYFEKNYIKIRKIDSKIYLKGRKFCGIKDRELLVEKIVNCGIKDCESTTYNPGIKCLAKKLL